MKLTPAMQKYNQFINEWEPDISWNSINYIKPFLSNEGMTHNEYIGLTEQLWAVREGLTD